MSTKHKRFNVQAQPQFSFYIERASGLLVPLIAADQLPANIRFHCIPRTLRADQVFGLARVGELPDPTYTFQLDNSTTNVRDFASTSQLESGPPQVRGFNSQVTGGYHHRRERSGPEYMRSFNPPEAPPRRPSTAGNPFVRGERAPPPSPQDFQVPSWRRNADKSATATLTTATINTAHPTEERSALKAILSTSIGSALAEKSGYKPRPETYTPDGKLINQEQKEYCTHWIRTGECDYTQQGCKFKHHMPDVRTLNNIGFKTTPRWWVEEMGLRANMTTTAKSGAGAGDSVGKGSKSSNWLKVVTEDGSDSKASSSLKGKDSDSASTITPGDNSDSDSDGKESVSGPSGPASSVSSNNSKTASDNDKDKESVAGPTTIEMKGLPAPLIPDLISFSEDSPTPKAASTSAASPGPSSSPISGEKQVAATNKTADTPAPTTVPSPSKPSTPKDGKTPSQSPKQKSKKPARRSSPTDSRHSSLDSSEPLPPSPKNVGKQKAKLNAGRQQQQQQGLMASMHASAAEGSEVIGAGAPRGQKTYRGRAGRFQLPVAKASSSSLAQ